MRLPDDIQTDDVHAWLDRTWVKVHGAPYQFSGIDEEGMVELRSLDGDYCSRRFSEIETWWPRLGAINIPHVGAVILTRQTRRQWRRSFAPGLVRVSTPGRWELVKAGLSGHPVMYQSADQRAVVRAIDAGNYPASPREALTWLEAVPTVALSPQIVFVRTSQPGTYRVYYHGELAGSIEDREFTPALPGKVGRRVNKLIGELT